MNEDLKSGNGRNEAFTRLYAVVERLEWSGVSSEGKANCPSCGAPGSGGSHLATCELRSALDAVTIIDHWPWCHCDACECPNQVNPAMSGALCADCERDVHR